MGSQTLEILRQGVWASLTGGWFYDPHQDVFCNTFHLYLWLFLLCLPFTIYVYFPPSRYVWYVYCGSVTVALTAIKLVNYGLHRMYDTTECIQEEIEDDWATNKREEDGIELQDLSNKSAAEVSQQACNSMASFADVSTRADVSTDVDSVDSIDYLRVENGKAKTKKGIIDLKAEVHRKNSSASSDELMEISGAEAYPFCGNVVMLTDDCHGLSHSPTHCFGDLPGNKHSKVVLDGLPRQNLREGPRLGLRKHHRPDPDVPHVVFRRYNSHFRNSSLSFIATNLQSDIKPTGSLELSYIDKNPNQIIGSESFYFKPGPSRTNRVRRIRSTALEICCPPPTLAIHPNSVEIIGAHIKGAKNPLPPPSSSLVRNQHLNLCPYYRSEIVFPIAEQSDEHQTSHGPDTDLDSITLNSDSDYEDNNQESACPLLVTIEREREHECDVLRLCCQMGSCANGKKKILLAKPTQVETDEASNTSKDALLDHENSNGESPEKAKSEKVDLEYTDKKTEKNFGSNSSLDGNEACGGPKREKRRIRDNKNEENMQENEFRPRLVRKRNTRRNRKRKSEPLKLKESTNFSSLVELDLDWLFDDENEHLKYCKDSNKRSLEWSSTTTVSLEQDVSKVLQETVPAATSLGAIPKKLKPLRAHPVDFEEPPKLPEKRKKRDGHSNEHNQANAARNIIKESKLTQTNCPNENSSSVEGLECLVLPYNNQHRLRKMSNTRRNLKSSNRNRLDPYQDSSTNTEAPSRPLLNRSDFVLTPGVQVPKLNVTSAYGRVRYSNCRHTRHPRTSRSAHSSGNGDKGLLNSLMGEPSNQVNFTCEGPIYYYINDNGKITTYSLGEKGLVVANTMGHLNNETTPPEGAQKNNLSAESFHNSFDSELCNISISELINAVPTLKSGGKTMIPTQNTLLSTLPTAGARRRHVIQPESGENAQNIDEESLMDCFADILHNTPNNGNRNREIDTTPRNRFRFIQEVDTLNNNYPRTKTYYKFKVFPCSKHLKVTLDRLKLLTLLDRNLTLTETIFSVILGVLVAIFGALLLNLQFYQDLQAFIFCFIIASCQYSLLKSVQPDAASPTHGFNRIIAYSRPVYFVLFASLALLFHALLPYSDQLEFTLFNVTFKSGYINILREFFRAFILFFPFLFSMGLFPQINTFAMYFFEQIDIHCFGGNAMSSLSASFYCIFRSFLAVSVLYGLAYGGLTEPKTSQHVLFSFFCACLISSSYHLSRSASDPSHVWNMLKANLWPPDIYREHKKAPKTRENDEKSRDTSQMQEKSKNDDFQAKNERLHGIDEESPSRSEGRGEYGKNDEVSYKNEPLQSRSVFHCKGDELYSKNESLHFKNDQLHGRSVLYCKNDDMPSLQSRNDALNSRNDGFNNRNDSVNSRNDGFNNKTDGLNCRNDGLGCRSDAFTSKNDSLHMKSDQLCNKSAKSDDITGKNDELLSKNDALPGKNEELSRSAPNPRNDDPQSKHERAHGKRDEAQSKNSESLQSKSDILQYLADESNGRYEEALMASEMLKHVINGELQRRYLKNDEFQSRSNVSFSRNDDFLNRNISLNESNNESMDLSRKSGQKSIEIDMDAPVGTTVFGIPVNDDSPKKKKTKPNNIDDLVDPLPYKLQKTINARLRSDVILCSFIALAVFGIHMSTVFTALQPNLRPVLVAFCACLGLFLHYLIPQMRKQLPWLCIARPLLRSQEHDYYQVRGAAHIMWFERIYVYLCLLERNILYPLLVLACITEDSPKMVEKFGALAGTLLVVICGIKCMRSAYSNQNVQYIIVTFALLFFKFDYSHASEGFLMNYFIMGIIFSKVYELLLKVQFVVTYIAPWQITWGSAFHAFAQPFAVPHSAMLFFQAILSAVLSTPLSPFLGSAIFLTSYVRPIKFWERDYNTRRVDHSNTPLSSHLDRNLGADDNNLNSIFYEHLTRSLQHSLCGDLMMGRWGPVSQGDCFVLASDYLNCLVHIIELGNGLVTFQMRGLEFRGTYCQQREVEAITEGVEENDGCCCCDPGHLPNMLSVNAAFSQRWLAWEVTAAKYVLEGYSISDNSAMSMLQVYDFRKVLITYYVKSIIFYAIRSNKLEDWLGNQSLLKALEPMSDRNFVDLDCVFNSNVDEDYDSSASGMTRTMFFTVYGPWIFYCAEKCEKNVDTSLTSSIVLLCFALSLVGRRTLSNASYCTAPNVEYFLYGLHALFKGDFRIQCARDEWVFSDVDLLKTVVAPGVKMSLKLHQDHFMAPDDYDEMSALFDAILKYEEELVICHEGDPAWRNAVLSGTPSLLSLRHVLDDGSDEYKIIMLNKRHLSFRVIQVNKECVRGLWAGQQQELVYLRNRNPERGSIQNAKQALRNIINSSCDQPIGYPIYVSPLTTSYAETNEQMCSLVGGSISLSKIRNQFLDLFRRIRKRCGEGCSSGGSARDDLGLGHEGVYAMTPMAALNHHTAGSQSTEGSHLGGSIGRGSSLSRMSVGGNRGSFASMGKPTSSTLASLAGLFKERDERAVSQIPDGQTRGDERCGEVDSGEKDLINQRVKIVDPNLVYDCINLGRRIDVMWPNEQMRMKGGRSYWRDWLPETGMEGNVVHRWIPSHKDASKRSHVDRTILLLQIDDKFVPIADGGVQEVSGADT